MKTTLVYTIVLDSETILFPPLGDNSHCDFVAFTNLPDVTSSHWEVRFDESICNQSEEMISHPRTYIPGYEEYIYAASDQVICGSFAKDKGNLLTIPSIPSLLPDHMPLIEPAPQAEVLPNPTFTDGPFDGYPLQLSICLPISNKKETLHKCLDGLKPLLDNLKAELIVVDTSTDGSRDIAESYGAKIIPFTWINDFAAARNAAIREAKGAWIFSIDDDEWFENVDEIIKFFGTKQWKTCDVAYYIVRNYNNPEGKGYSDFPAQRLAKNHPSLHYVDVIHECYDLSFLGHKPRAKYFTNFAHHFGYAYKNDADRDRKVYRNISGLYTALKASPLDLRLHLQLCTELTTVREFNASVTYCFKLLSLCQLQMQSPTAEAQHWKRVTMVFLYVAAQIINDQALFPKIYDLTELDEFNYFQKASIYYFLLSNAFNNLEYEQACNYAKEYYALRKEYLTAPSKPTLSTSITVDVVEPQLRCNTALILHAFSLMKLEKEEECVQIFSKIDFEIIDDNDKNFIGTILYWLPTKPFIKYFPKADKKMIAALYRHAQSQHKNALNQSLFFIDSGSNSFETLAAKINAADCFKDNPDVRMIQIYGNPSDFSTYDWFCKQQAPLETSLDDICVPAALNGYELRNFTSKLKLEGIQQMIRALSSISKNEFLEIFEHYLRGYVDETDFEGISLGEIYLFTGFLESHVLNITDSEAAEIKEQYLDVFICYIKLLNKWTHLNYNAKMFEEENISLLPATSRGGLHMAKAFDNLHEKDICIAHIKSAVAQCPLFDRGAKLLLKKLLEAKAAVSPTSSDISANKQPKTEFELLGEQLKSTAKQLIGAGQFTDAQNILLQLTNLLPGDNEVKELLTSCQASNLVH